MYVAEHTEPATSTDSRGTTVVRETHPFQTTHVATAPTGRVCAEKMNQLFYLTGKVLGWVIEFLHDTAQKNTDAGKLISSLCVEVDDMESIPANWNGYGSEAPNLVARKQAVEILLAATSIIVPNRVSPSAQGGVGICFYNREKYADIECLNSGEVLATTSTGKGVPEVWQIFNPAEVKGALERIGKFINS